MSNQLLKKAIGLKISLAKTTPKKFYALKRRTGKTGRNHGSLTFCGAKQTGRWASLGINLQNLMRPAFGDVPACIDLLPERDFDLLNFYFGDSTEAISSCIRGMLTAKPGSRLLIGDFASIEARIIAWLAGAESSLEVFRTHGKIYEHAASQIFDMPIDQIGKKSDERFAGKTTILACGFQGGWRALQKMAKDNGVELSQKMCAKIVTLWRKENPEIVTYWDTLQQAAVKAIQNPGQKFLVRDEPGVPKIYYKVVRNVLYCQLPSGRLLSYNNPSLDKKTVRYFKIDGEYPISIVYNKEAHGSAFDFSKLAKSHGAKISTFEAPSIRFWGIHSKTYKWSRLHTYGGSLAENVTQAIARDLLAVALLRTREAGYTIVLHVHDEIVAEEKYGTGNIEEFLNIMRSPVDWAEGLPMGVEGEESFRYKK